MNQDWDQEPEPGLCCDHQEPLHGPLLVPGSQLWNYRESSDVVQDTERVELSGSEVTEDKQHLNLLVVNFFSSQNDEVLVMRP